MRGTVYHTTTHAKRPPKEAAYTTAGKAWLRAARRVVISVVGITVLLIGVVLLVLPGPAMLVIPVGLAILATEFVWAQRWLHSIKQTAAKTKTILTTKFSAGARREV